MACINPSGEISEAARKILGAMLEPASLPQVADRTGLPLYRIRSAMRELAEAGLALESESGWRTTEAGHAAIERALAPV